MKMKSLYLSKSRNLGGISVPSLSNKMKIKMPGLLTNYYTGDGMYNRDLYINEHTDGYVFMSKWSISLTGINDTIPRENDFSRVGSQYIQLHPTEYCGKGLWEEFNAVLNLKNNVPIWFVDPTPGVELVVKIMSKDIIIVDKGEPSNNWSQYIKFWIPIPATKSEQYQGASLDPFGGSVDCVVCSVDNEFFSSLVASDITSHTVRIGDGLSFSSTNSADRVEVVEPLFVGNDPEYKEEVPNKLLLLITKRRG